MAGWVVVGGKYSKKESMEWFIGVMVYWYIGVSPYTTTPLHHYTITPLNYYTTTPLNPLQLIGVPLPMGYYLDVALCPLPHPTQR